MREKRIERRKEERHREKDRRREERTKGGKEWRYFIFINNSYGILNCQHLLRLYNLVYKRPTKYQIKTNKSNKTLFNSKQWTESLFKHSLFLVGHWTQDMLEFKVLFIPAIKWCLINAYWVSQFLRCLPYSTFPKRANSILQYI